MLAPVPSSICLRRRRECTSPHEATHGLDQPGQKNLRCAAKRRGMAQLPIATIHPYSRWKTAGPRACLRPNNCIQGTYGLKGLYALEEYYARDLKAYYEALTVDPHIITIWAARGQTSPKWIEYFIDGMTESFEKVREERNRESQRVVPGKSRLLAI